MLTLAITTSTAQIGVAVGDEKTIYAHSSQSIPQRHGEDLVPMIKQMYAEIDVELDEMQLIAVDVGPGRFTGLRVGIATAVTFAYALKIDVAPISSLSALAYGRSEPGEQIAAVIDARRNEVFQQVFDSETNAISGQQVGDPAVLSASINCKAIGDGADKYNEIYNVSAIGCEPNASSIVKLAQNAESFDPKKIEPMYLREPDAVANIKVRDAK